MTRARSDFTWDPEQYTRYASQRARPLLDLLARVPAEQPRLVVDLGCGPGTTTGLLAQRWPGAQVLGVDSSPQMIEAAAAHRVADRLEFALADARSYEPPAPVDVVVANAVLHWLPDHLGLLRRYAGWLTPGGALAFQVPDNFAEPSHTLPRDLARTPEWADRLAGTQEAAAVATPAAYFDALLEAGLAADVWQTTYLHLLMGDNPVLEWLKGTALRPVLSALSDDPPAAARFLAELEPSMAAAYPPTGRGTILPFRRTFGVGTRG